MHDPFPVFRLVTLLARQLSSPIATRIKEYAKTHPQFARLVCMRSGRAVAAAEQRFKMWSLQIRGPHAVNAPPVLTDQRALDSGADLLGEFILFSLAIAIAMFEFNRQAVNQEAKVAQEASAWLAVRLQLEELEREVQAQQRDLDRLATMLQAIVDPHFKHKPEVLESKPEPMPEVQHKP